MIKIVREYIKKYIKNHEKLVLSLITILITSIVQNIFWCAQNRITCRREDRKKQIEIISDLIEETSHIEMLREKIYWNKFFAHVSPYINGEESEKGSFVKEHMNLEDQYRKDYEEVVSKYEATLIESGIYFENQENNIETIEEKLSKGFGFDGDYIDEQYDQLVKQGYGGSELLDELEKLIGEEYNKDFFDESCKYAKQLRDEIK